VFEVRGENAMALVGQARTLRHAARLARQHAASVRADSRALRGSAGEHRLDGSPRARRGEYVVVEVAGVADIASRDALTAVLNRAVRCGAPAVVVDLSRVTLLAAAGLHCLERAAELLAGHGGRLHLVCPANAPAARALRILDPDDAWSLHADVAAAAATISSRL
jgi:anti-anti-sigma regulatory factor